MKKYKLIMLILLTGFSVNAQQDSFKNATGTTETVATEYFNVYMAMDWDRLGRLMHRDITFEDPTAQILFGEKKPAGKDDVLRNFREGYASLTEMTPRLSRTFFSGGVGIFEMDLTFGFRNRQNGITTIKMPLVVVITVRDGKVIEHRDYGDYREYIKQIRAAQENADGKI